MKLRVYRGDWFFNMGIVGFLNIIKKADKQAEIFIMEDYIEFDSLFLENFHEYYFNYFMDEYDVSKRIKKNIDYSINFIKSKPDRIKDGIKKIKDSVKQQNDKIKKFDEEKFNLIKEKLDSMSKIKSYDEFDSLEALVDETIDIFKIKSINDRLTANLYKYVVQDNYFGQVSFFNVAKAKLDLDGLKQVMFNDYLRQIIYFGELADLLEENDYDKLKNYLNDRLNSIAKDINEKKVSKSSINTIEKIMKEINKNFIKKNKSIEDIKDIKEYMDSLEVCEMCGLYKGILDEYSESNFAPLGVSTNNARNMFWNQAYVPSICDICKLILFCTPAGATYTRKNYLINEENEFYLFVNMDTSINELFERNNSLKAQKSEYSDSKDENPFNQLIKSIVEENTLKSEWQLRNIFFVEFKASIDSKKCKINYFNIPTYLAKFFTDKYANKKIQSIYDYKLKSNVLDLLLKNRDLKHLTNNILRNKVKNDMESNNKSNISGIDCFRVVQLRALINSYKKGVYKMDSKNLEKNDEKLRIIYYLGCDIHDYFVNKNSKNKIDGVSYKLLNSVKVGNKSDFMDTIIRVFMSAEKQIPAFILDIEIEKDLDFESIGHAFISGLISGKYEGKDKLPNEKEEK
ncbi:TPA: type I-B CRISPR-associated protein Cas8b1/Cst1 [Clostridioides difficile]|uniref:type I-B CRISPR-associated protein Cas8b1/Cst1 n=3 Tax=Clostridioides difficile TaxID=1496 RepID=UPI0008A10CA8|nr:type I-B CRISPR-associated protein Cas8b1/Cst1 [Clostridioides difficile]OFU01341.1 type I-B CRISPR-associated protein Cas8b1/Cst1 [Clostridium sp. HMSC19D07]EGT4529861.1 type I-B CRISPR-associated protein Cas8b1/Cst1 [Clostridioides difficile]EGT4709163.1 type I-B CRISPR-associated protein Cas8b1/Cst1 [Clostridioides difficile]EGT4834699.1 type I-B CRISPR-associated protein Cas8b1/Cst1 [Clostridioides difficile]EGT4912064.1 type I-B CRISPR-associated protein Cas8b1/Cst1 [Clostridioides dif